MRKKYTEKTFFTEKKFFLQKKTYVKNTSHTAQKMKFSIKDFFSKCEQIRRKLRICSHLLKKSFMENFIFCTVSLEIFHTKNVCYK